MKIDFVDLKVLHDETISNVTENPVKALYHKIMFTIDGMYLGHIFYYKYFLDYSDKFKDKLGFIDQDILDLISELKKKEIPDGIVNIQSIVVKEDHRGKGFGSMILEKFINYLDARDDTVFITKSGPLKEMYPTEPDEETYVKENRIQAYFLETNGFRNINSLCNFEFGVPYIYINNSAKPILREIIKSEIN